MTKEEWVELGLRSDDSGLAYHRFINKWLHDFHVEGREMRARTGNGNIQVLGMSDNAEAVVLTLTLLNPR